MADSSARTIASRKASRPPATHTARIAPGRGRRPATSPGVRKIPAPIATPIAMAAPSLAPRIRSSDPRGASPSTACYLKPRMELFLVDSTLREGEQFAGVHWSFAQKQEIALLADLFGVEYLEVGSPAASPQTLEDARRLRDLNLHLRILAHVRCLKADV